MKTITLHQPRAVRSALSDLDRYFDSFFGDSVFAPASRGLSLSHVPAVDVRETEKSYVLDMELPGYDEKDINIHVDGNSLSIASRNGDAKKDDGEDQGAWLIRERRISTFSRSFKLPENADPEGISAEFRNGVLSLEIGKRPEAQKRSIQINAK